MPKLNELTVSEKLDPEQISYDFSEELNGLEQAINSTKRVKDLAKNVADKNWFSTWTAGITGSSDKELAKCVKELSGGLETTQKIVQMMLKIGQGKNDQLKIFHQALVDKICSLETNTGDLDMNQQGANQAMLLIAVKMREQVEEKIAYQEKIQQQSDELHQVRTELINLQEDVRGQAAMISILKNGPSGVVLRVISFTALGLSMVTIILTFIRLFF